MADMGSGYVAYMGHQWLTVEGEVITIGVMEEALDEIEGIIKIDLPAGLLEFTSSINLPAAWL